METLSAEIKLLPATACATNVPAFETCMYVTVTQKDKKENYFTSYILKLVSEAKRVTNGAHMSLATEGRPGGPWRRDGGSFCTTSNTLEAWLRGADAPPKQVQESTRPTDGRSPRACPSYRRRRAHHLYASCFTERPAGAQGSSFKESDKASSHLFSHQTPVKQTDIINYI